MQEKRLIASLLLASVFAAPSAAAEQQRRQGAHVHGVGQLNIAVDGAIVAVELDSPAANVIGFEHAPRNAAERASRKRALERLQEGESLFALPAAAGCRLEHVQLAGETAGRRNKGVAGHQDDHDRHQNTERHADKGGEQEHVHADIRVSYRFRCGEPSALNAMDVRLFKVFPATERLQVQLIGPRGQRGARLTPAKARLEF